MDKNKKLIIVGDGEFAEIAYDYFSHDSVYEVVAFSVEREYIKKKQLFNLPVIPFEDLEKRFNKAEYDVFVAVTYTQLNRVRKRLYKEVKNKGFKPISYVSSKAFLWHNVEIGENCFIFENNVLQYSVKLGNNIILWSGNHIGHRTVIKDHCYIASHAVISGYCEIEENCFLGVNCTLADNIKIAKDCVIGAGALITRNTREASVYKVNSAAASNVSSLKLFRVKNISSE